MRLNWLKMLIHAHFSRQAILNDKVGQTDLAFGVRSVGLCTQDYKSLCAAVTMSATLVNIQTRTHIIQTDRHHLSSFYE